MDGYSGKDDYSSSPGLNHQDDLAIYPRHTAPVERRNDSLSILISGTPAGVNPLQLSPNNSTLESKTYGEFFDKTLTEDILETDKSEKFPQKSEAQEDRIKGLEAFNEPDPVINPITRFATWFTPYRKIFFLVVVLNLVGCILELTGVWKWATKNLTPLVVGNVLIAILIRNEWFVRFLYWCAVKVFRPAIFPVWLRAKVVGILYHIGGLHSGCGFSALLWILVSSIRHFSNVKIYHPAVLTSLAICVVCILFTCVAAFPVFRGPHHNLFEQIHRFVGWAGLISTFLFILFSSAWDENLNRWNLSSERLIFHPELWFIVTIFALIISSWITTANVPVKIRTSSDKASVIRLPGGLTSGVHTRISKGGLQEWHIFGSISEGKSADCHYIVAAVQGEFTRMLNVEKPQELYTKTWKPCGLPYFSRMFHKGVAICTGSGIGAVGSTCIQHDDWFLVWIGPDLEKTYGKEIMDLITSKITPERRLIWDTRSSLGRPNVVKLLRHIYKTWNAEVALFIGSPALNKQVLQTSRALKLPVFGSIWDA
ncbi:hypothetical protein BY996DRAFT_4595987 [Phakopsora pachyrhizi]|uniref:Non-ribosomal peptide synthetase n=1 Tax=Phakopsora pachyrhizi TaxID=170000 RepID=A0AAV0B861_PHAPC|nr:hypothetical protein BY996DRAFT_4595987 [Phakopsora pachyrhizi]CAH7683372.1 hypothetical protein PPACK8108_LOCUS16828 [Phakopsora pachyrhizi]